MRILFLSHRVPYPPDKGDRIRSYNIIKHLARNHSISLMSVSHEPVRPGSREALEELCESVQIVEIDPTVSKLKSAGYLLSNQPLTLPAFYSRRLHRAVRDKLENSAFDLIYIYSSSMAQYVLGSESRSRKLHHEGHEWIGDVPAGPIAKVMDFIDVDSQKWFDYAATARQPMTAIYRREGRRLRAFEKRVAACCRLSLFTTDSELQLFKSFAPEARAMALPNGVDLTPMPSQAYRPNRLVFVGSMDYLPNIDAMLYFTDEILPLIEKAIPEVELFIVGRNPSSQVKALGRLKNVTVTGEVADVGSYLRDAAASVIPLRIARGIQTKILEAMAHGVPAIATGNALDGIGAKPGREVLVADKPHDFAGKTIAVLRDRSMRAQLAANARTLVEQNYRWETQLQKLDDAIVPIFLNSHAQKPQAVQILRAVRGKNLISQEEPSSPDTDVRSESDGLNQTRTAEQPFVSFVIPAKNEEKMIGQCLDAINNLTYDPTRCECIVVDNGSVDDTAKIAKQKGAKVMSMPNGTIAGLRNFGAKAAHGEYLAFIDADCVINASWLQHTLPHFDDPEVGCVGCHPGIPADASWVEKTWNQQTGNKAMIEEVDWLGSANILVRRLAFVETRGFNESLTTCEDVDFCYRLKKQFKIISDSDIKSVHFGEVRTVSEFYRKERWRGQSNLQGLISHGFHWQEVPSLVLPIYYVVAIICLPITLVNLVAGPYLPFFFNVVAVLLPSLLLAFRTSLRAGDFTRFAPLTYLYFLYSLARASAIVRSGDYRTSDRLENCSKVKDVTI